MTRKFRVRNVLMTCLVLSCLALASLPAAAQATQPTDTSAGNLLVVLRESRGENKQDESLQPVGKIRASLDDGSVVEVETSGIAADSLGARRVGELMFPIAQKYVPEVVLVTDEQIIEAQRTLWQRLRIVAEPGGATALAALLSGAYQPKAGECVGVVICGGNAELGSFPV